MAFDLRKLLGLQVPQQHHQISVHRASQGQLGNNTDAARAYEAYFKKPVSQQVGPPPGGDPAQFGYPADNSGSQLQVQQSQAPMNLGVPSFSSPQLQGQQNPGFTPLQGSNTQLNQNPQFQGFGTNPQQLRHRNPQLSDTGYFWDQ